tara:strand:- start:3249 stop:4862 length:1614 start_codon:yes stop_codon:yes gene_type:complete
MVKNYLNELDALKNSDYRNLSKFYSFLVDFFNKWECSCFLSDNNSKYNFNSLKIDKIAIEKIDFNTTIRDYDERIINFLKGYIFYLLDDYKNSYKFLSKIIDENKYLYKTENYSRLFVETSDLAYWLRSKLSSVNKNCYRDAKLALSYNKCIRNLHNCSQKSFHNKEYNESIDYANGSLEINPNFFCSLKQKAGAELEVNDSNSIHTLLKCFKLKPKHNTIPLHIWGYYVKKKSAKEAYKFAEIFKKLNPDNLYYNYMLGCAKVLKNENHGALELFNTFLKEFSGKNKYLNEIEFSKSFIDYVNTNRSSEIINEIKEIENNISNYFLEKKYYLVENEFNKSKLKKYNLSKLTNEKYLMAILKIYNIDIEINENHTFFISIDNAKKSYENKLSEHKKFSEKEINNSKLVIYNENTELKFGKNKHHSIYDILVQEPKYILWCIKNLDHFAIDNYIFTKEYFKKDRSFYLALEKNLIKNLVFEKWNKKFFLKKVNNSKENYYKNTFDNYNGSYAQDVEGWSDQDIWDVFDGDPGAYWNID